MKWITWSGFRGTDGVWGGDLVDINTPFAGRDKTVHFTLGAAAWLFFQQWMNPLAALMMVLILAIANEIVEGIRYRYYGYTRILSDIPDAADVVATLAGGFVVLLVSALVNLVIRTL